MKMHTHTHKPETPAPTEGRLVPRAAFYDVTVNIMSFGLIGRLCKLTVDHALLKPGESVLDVGCGAGGGTIPAKLRVGRNGKAA